MKTKKILNTFILFFLSICSYAQQNLPDFQMVENNYPNKTEFEIAMKGSENVFFNNSTISMIFLADSVLNNRDINNLHLYLLTRPGQIIFGDQVITPESIKEYESYLITWRKMIRGRIIIHSNDVFNEEAGIILKQKLEEITGLTFELRGNRNNK